VVPNWGYCRDGVKVVNIEYEAMDMLVVVEAASLLA